MNVLSCARVLHTKKKCDWNRRKCLPSLVSFLKTLTLSMTFSSSPSDAVDKNQCIEILSLLMYRKEIKIISDANFMSILTVKIGFDISIVSKKILRFNTSVHIPSYGFIHPFFFLSFYVGFTSGGIHNLPFHPHRSCYFVSKL